MKKKNKRVHGVGINDADYVVKVYEVIGYKDCGKRVQKIVWSCPVYTVWSNMLSRCYYQPLQEKFPTYIGCSVTPDWHYFMTFKAWVLSQDWEGKQLDKDLLVKGNKIYSPDTCVFVDNKVNLFLTERKASRGEWPIGVDFHKTSGKFQARCWSVETGKKKYLGLYETPEQAHQAWLTFKLEQAKILASQQTDPRIAKALIERYENYAT